MNTIREKSFQFTVLSVCVCVCEMFDVLLYNLDTTTFVALVRERTIPTERPLLVGEVSANFCG
jgi:hypothetical protein